MYNQKLKLLGWLIQFDKKYLNYKFDSILIRKAIELNQLVFREYKKPKRNIQFCIDEYDKKIASPIYDDPVDVLSEQEYEEYE